MESGRFTLEELEAAKSADLCQVAETPGYTIKRVRNFYTLKEMDSVRIYHRKSWCRFPDCMTVVGEEALPLIF